MGTYNATTGRVQTLRVLGKGGLSPLNYDFGKAVGSFEADDLPNILNSTDKLAPFSAAYDSSRNQILKVPSYVMAVETVLISLYRDNGRNLRWAPNPTVSELVMEIGF